MKAVLIRAVQGPGGWADGRVFFGALLWLEMHKAKGSHVGPANFQKPTLAESQNKGRRPMKKSQPNLSGVIGDFYYSDGEDPAQACVP